MPNFTPVNELERLLLAAATDLAARPAFYSAVAEHELFIITDGRKPDQPGKVTLVNEPIPVRIIELDGEEFAPVFSSTDRISEYVTREAGYLAMQGRDLLAMLRGKNLILNPGSGCGRSFAYQEVDAILDGSMFKQPETSSADGDGTQLSQPEELPSHITEALSKFFAKRKEVNAAYLAQAGGPTPRILIGVEAASHWQGIVQDAGEVVQEVAQPGETIDFVEVTAISTDPVSQYMRQQTPPFYKRKKWLGLF